MAQSKQTIQDATMDALGTFGNRDSTSAYSRHNNRSNFSNLLTGVVEQMNIGMYSALVSTSNKFYICSISTMNVCQGFGYSDDIVLREGDEVIFSVVDDLDIDGVILARKPTHWSIDDTHPKTVESDTKLERRSSFFGNDCYRKEVGPYDTPLKRPTDISTARYINNRLTDLVAGESGSLNPHHNGSLYNMYSSSICGGGAHIKIYSIENRMRVVADSIIRYTLTGNDNDWHNRRYLTHERHKCMYQEERLGMKSKQAVAFQKCDYDKEFYFIKNKKKRQTLRPRIFNQEGYFGNLSVDYCFRPDPDDEEPRTMDDTPIDPGVTRNSTDPSGQRRLAATGMISSERIGRIPVPVRILQPWHKEAEDPEKYEETLEEFKHSESHPFYRQLELADRVAYDLKNSYKRLDDAKTEFYVPEENEMEGKLQDIYDPGFTNSKTVKLKKYDKRRSGIWQGEDGSIIIRDAWGSEIVMIGGNIQIACAGNVEMLPGKSALTLAGDDIVHKAQNSVDIEAADKDVRVSALKNIQMLAGADEFNPGGITIETLGPANVWDGTTPKGGESVSTRGILLKSHDGAIVADALDIIEKAGENLSIVTGRDATEDEEAIQGSIMVSTDGMYTYSEETIAITPDAALIMDEESILLTANTVLTAGRESATVMQGKDVMIPLMWAGGDTDVADEVLEDLDKLEDAMTDDIVVSYGYSEEFLKKMHFKYRSSDECDTLKSWEIEGSEKFTLYEPFWVQVITKFETLKNKVRKKPFEYHRPLWEDSDYGMPWPGEEAVKKGKYAKLENESPINMDDDGFNKPRKGDSLKKETPVIEVDLFPGYQVRRED